MIAEVVANVHLFNISITVLNFCEDFFKKVVKVLLDLRFSDIAHYNLTCDYA